MEIVKIEAVGVGTVYQVGRFIFTTKKAAKEFVAKFASK